MTAATLGPSTSSHNRVIRPVAGWLLIFGVLLAYKGWTLRIPATLDASWSVFPGGITLAENGFNLIELIRAPHHFDLGPGTHATSPITWLTGLVVLVVGSGMSLLPWLHVVHLAIGAIALQQLYRMARFAVPPAAATGFLVIVAAVPVFSAQLGFMYLEIPQLAATVFAVNAYLYERHRTAAAWGAAATLVKAAGIVGPVALGLTAWWRDRSAAGARLGLLLAAPSLVVAGVTSLVGSSALEVVADFPVSELLGRGIVVSYLATFDLVLLTAIPLVLFKAVRTSDRLSAEQRTLHVVAVAIVVTFVLMYLALPILGIPVHMLNRYFVQIVPFAVLASGLTLWAVFGRRLTIGAAVAFLVLSVLNLNGAFYPFPDRPSDILQEHSNSYADLVLANRDGFEQMAALDIPIVVDANQWFRATYPDIGFVEEPLDGLVRIGPEHNLPDRFVMMENNDSVVLMDELLADADWSSVVDTVSRGPFDVRVVVFERR